MSKRFPKFIISRTKRAEKAQLVNVEDSAPKPEIPSRLAYWFTKFRIFLFGIWYYPHIRFRRIHDHAFAKKRVYYKAYCKPYRRKLQRVSYLSFAVSFVIFMALQYISPFNFSGKPRGAEAGASSKVWSTYNDFNTGTTKNSIKLNGLGSPDDLSAGTTTLADPTLAWNQKSPANKPSARNGHAMAYDSNRQKVVLFGGNDGSNKGDTWEWDGTNWTQVASTGPSGRNGHAMAYDSVRQKVVLFGGYDGSNKGDTWEWNGTSWTQVASTGPSARVGHAMAYDSNRQKVVLFGGGHFEDISCYCTLSTNETWEWNGTSWTPITPANKPSARDGHAMAYDSNRQKVVLFGGYDTSGYPNLNDTWEWNGTSWTQVASTGPSARADHAMAYDSNRQKVVLFGGQDAGWTYKGDTWDWNGTNWTQVASTGPAARVGHAMAYDSNRQKVVLFGGYEAGLNRDDTWAYESLYPFPGTLGGTASGNVGLRLDADPSGLGIKAKAAQVTWNGTTSLAGQKLLFKVRAGDNQTELNSASCYGPSASEANPCSDWTTAGKFFSQINGQSNSSTAVLNTIPSKRYIEIIARLESDGGSTPTLNDVTLTYDSLEAPNNSNTTMYKTDGTSLLKKNDGTNVTAGIGGGFTNEISIKINVTGLTCTGCGTSTNRKIEVEAKPTDQAFDGTGTVQGDSVVNGSNYDSTATISGLTVGTAYHLRIRSIDSEGRQSGWVSLGGNSDGNPPGTPADADFTIEQTPPSAGSFTIKNDDQYTNSLTVDLTSISSTDTGGSNLGFMSFSNDGNSWSSWEAFGTTKTGWTLSDTQSNPKTVYARFMDNAGNVSGKMFTAQADWEATTRNQVDITSSNGDVKLAQNSADTGTGTDGALVVDGTTASNNTLNGSPISGGPFNSGNPLVLDTQVVRTNRIYNFTSVTLQNGAVVTHTQGIGAGTSYPGITLKIQGTLSIDATSKIDVSGKGYSGGAINTIGSGPGAASGCGAAYGGSGGCNLVQNGLTYGDSNLSTVYLGSGGSGGTNYAGGNGGGAIKITANSFNIVAGGYIQADGFAGAGGGSNQYPGHGGSGGSIYIISNNDISNSGSISAKGGWGGLTSAETFKYGYGGGGGRIKIEAPSVNGANPDNTYIEGGQIGTGGCIGTRCGLSGSYNHVVTQPYQISGTLGSTGTGLRTGDPTGSQYNWTNLKWSGSGISATYKVKVQVRPADTWGSGDTGYVNPSTGALTWYEITSNSGSVALSSSFTNTKTLEARLELIGDGANTPTLSDLTVEYSPLDTILYDATPPAAPTTNLVLTPTSLKQGNVNLSWDAVTDPDSGTKEYKIYRSKDGGAYNYLATSLTNSYTDTSFASAGPTDEGRYLYQVSVVDNALNEGSKSADFPALVLDQTAPDIPTSFTVTPNTWTNATNFTFNFTVSDPNIGASPGSQVSKFYYKVGSAPTTTGDLSTNVTCASSPCSSSFNLTLSPDDNSHTLWVVPEDGAGNVNFANKISTTFKIDQTSATVSTFAINSGDTYTKNRFLSVSGIFTDATSSSPAISGSLQIQFSQDGTNWGKINGTNDGVLTTTGNTTDDWNNYSVSRFSSDTSQTISQAWYFTGSDSLTKTLYVRVKDAAGNVSSAVTDEIVLDTQVPDAPLNLALDKTVLNSGSITLTWSLSNDPAPSSQIKRYLIFRTKDNGTYTQVDTVNAPTTTYIDTSLSNPTALDEGSYTYKVVAEDNALNQSSQSLASSGVTVDITSPTTPTDLSITPNSWTNQTSFDVTLTISDANAGASPGTQAKKLYYNIGSAPTLASHPNSTTVTCASSPCTQTVTLNLSSSLTADGTYTLYLTPEDMATNVSWANTATVTIQYDATGPTPPQPSSNFYSLYSESTANSIKLHWSAATDISGITAYQLIRKLNSDAWGVADWTSSEISGTATEYTDNNNGTDLLEGYKYTYKIRVKNSVGLWGDWSNEISASTRDSSKPTSPTNILAQPCDGTNYCSGTPGIYHKGFETKLTWSLSDDGPGTGVTGYKIYRKTTDETNYANWTESDLAGYLDVTTPGGPATLEWYDNDQTNTNTYTDTTFDPDLVTTGKQAVKPNSSKKLNEWQMYYYRVTAIDEAGNESYLIPPLDVSHPYPDPLFIGTDTNKGNGKTLDATGPESPNLDTPSVLGVDSHTPPKQKIKITWNKVEDLRNAEANRDPLGGTGSYGSGTKEYKVYRSLDNVNFTEVVLNADATLTVDANGVTFENQNLEERTTYYYKAKAWDNANNEGTQSNVVSVTTSDSQVPSTPDQVIVHATKGDPTTNLNIGKKLSIAFKGSIFVNPQNILNGYEVYQTTIDQTNPATKFSQNGESSDWLNSTKATLVKSYSNLNISGDVQDPGEAGCDPQKRCFKDTVTGDATSYYYGVRALGLRDGNMAVVSSFSTVSSVPEGGWDTTPDITKPDIPIEVEVKNIHGDGDYVRNIITWKKLDKPLRPKRSFDNCAAITVDGKEYCNDFKAYKLYRKPNQLGQNVWGQILIDGNNPLQRVDQNAGLATNYYVDPIPVSEGNQNYEYYVTAVDNAKDFRYQDGTVINDFENESVSSSLANINPGQAFANILTLANGKKSEVRNVGVSSVTVYWETDQASDSLVEYRIAGSTDEFIAVGSTKFVTHHSINLKALERGEAYEYRIISRNGLGNLTKAGYGTDDTNVAYLETQDFFISQTSYASTTTTATISWKTNLPSDSAVEYKLQKVPGEAEESSQTAGEPGLVTDHQVIVKALKPGRTYTYKIRSVTEDKYISETEFLTFVTKVFDTNQFTIAPDATKVAEENITATSARIVWDTAVFTTSWVEYGTETGKYTMSAGDNQLNTHHVIDLKNLTPGQLYYYRVKGKDISDIEYVSQEYQFTAVLKPEIPNIKIKGVSNYSATIFWETNVSTDSVIAYGKDEALGMRKGISEVGKSHEITLDNLEDNQQYYFQILARDKHGNETKSEVYQFKTPLDTTGAEIKTVKIDLLPMGSDDEYAGVIITWNTNKPSQKQIEYGEGVISGKYESKTTEDENFSTGHTVIIKDLNPSTTYHFRIKATDKRGNQTYSQDFSFVTPTKEKSILQLIIKSLEDTFSWVGNIGKLFRRR